MAANASADRQGLLQEGGGQPESGSAGGTSEEQPSTISRWMKAGKRRFGVFKVSALGIFLLQRWLPLQDVGSDALVTFGKESIPLCSDDGLFWDEQNPWWARLSAFFMILPYLLLWALMTPIMTRSGLLRKCPCCVKYGVWLVFGLPCCLILDVFMIVRYPISQPTSSWLLNSMRLRVVLETCVESPLQTALQTRIFWVKVTSHDPHLHQDFEVDWTLLFSICTSVVSLALTLVEIRDMAVEQKISFVGALTDTLFVGMGWRAPLLHVMKFQTAVDFGDEGALTDDHCEQIAAAASASDALRLLKFHLANQLTDAGKEAILGVLRRQGDGDTRVIIEVAGLLWPQSGAGWCGWKCGSGGVSFGFYTDRTGGTDGDLKACAAAWPAGATWIELHCNVGGGSLTDEGLEAVAKRLPAEAVRIDLRFQDNTTFTDAGLQALAKRLPPGAAHLWLYFRDNTTFTDAGLEALARHLPAGAAGIALDFTSNQNFTARGAEALKRHMPARTCVRLWSEDPAVREVCREWIQR